MSAIKKELHLNFWPETIDKIDYIAKTLSVGNKATALRMAVEIALVMIRAVKEGGNLIVEEKNGKKSKVIIAGLNT